MKGGKINIAIVVVLLILSNCAVSRRNEIKNTKWILGTWINETKKGNIYETWSKVNKNEYSGKSYTLKGNDTIVFESIRLVQDREGVTYIPTVKDQNSALPVRFSNKMISDIELVFENSEHDFPQMISYKKINSDSLIAEFSGIKNGKYRKETFPMRRMK